VTLLPAKAFDLCHGNTLYPHFCQSGSHIIKFEGFDDGDDHFHMGLLLFIRQECSLAARNARELLQHSMIIG
jgi:hypothetical protein